MGMLTAAGSLGRSALVVKEFTVNQEGPHYVHIVARRGGIINWLLTLCGINTTTILDIYEDRVLFEHGSLSGKLKSCMPLSAMSVASGGFFKPVIYLFWAFVFFIAAFFTYGITLLRDRLGQQLGGVDLLQAEHHRGGQRRLRQGHSGR